MRPITNYFLYFISSIAVLTAVFVAYLIWFQPPIFFPKPTGQYAVGCKDFHWVDTSRNEIYAHDAAHPNRELMVKIWYPTSAVAQLAMADRSLKLGGTNLVQKVLPEKPTTRYQTDLDYYCKTTHPLTWLTKHARPMYSYAQPNTTPIKETMPFPCVLFSHGYGETRESNTAYCEELASHGYIVVGMSHPYGSCFVQFPDGHSAHGLTEKTNTTVSKSFIQQHYEDLDIWLHDVAFVIDQLETLAGQEGSTLYQSIDTKNIGIFGHSYGGAVAMQMCRQNPRIKAGVVLDGPLYGKEAIKTFDKPCMFILAQETMNMLKRPFSIKAKKAFGFESREAEFMFKGRYMPAIKRFIKAMGSNAHTFVIQEAGHLDFCDITLHKNNFFHKQDLVGSIDGFRVTKIVNAYLVNFFDKYLKNKSSALLDGDDSQYPEVERRKK